MPADGHDSHMGTHEVLGRSSVAATDLHIGINFFKRFTHLGVIGAFGRTSLDVDARNVVALRCAWYQLLRLVLFSA